MKKLFAAFIPLACLLFATPAFAMDAHFFIRYDHSNADETGSTHYSPTEYFPVGDVAEGYEYGSSRSDYTSVDGQVASNSAYLDGVESIVTKGKVNLYNSFNVTAETIENAFAPVYDVIIQAPSNGTVSSSILAALGNEWQTRYDNGEIKVLWYVVKQEGSYVNVDGVLYYVSSGNVIDKDDPEPAPTPKPEPEPEPTPQPEPEPFTPSEDDTGEKADDTENKEQEPEDRPEEEKAGEEEEKLPQTGELAQYILISVDGILLAYAGYLIYKK